MFTFLMSSAPSGRSTAANIRLSSQIRNLKRCSAGEDVRLVSLPHVALSSKLHWDEYPDYLGEDILKIIESTVREGN